jgi:type 1 glutamine amidotransferase
MIRPLTLVLVLCFASVAGRAPVSAADRPLRALLVIGGCCHDYARQQEITKGISQRAPVEWTVAYDTDTGTRHLNPVYEKADWAKGYDLIVHNECAADVKDLATIEGILKPHREGLPSVVLHCGMHSYRSEGWPNAVTPWFEFTGLQTTGHGPQQPITITFTDAAHPITKGLVGWTTLNEELYNNLTGKLVESARPLARGRQSYRDKNGAEVTADTIVAWTNLYQGKTRVFATTLGHNNETVSDPRYLELVTRGLLWAAGRTPAAK